MAASSADATLPASKLVVENDSAMASTLKGMPREAANASSSTAVSVTTCAGVNSIRWSIQGPLH